MNGKLLFSIVVTDGVAELHCEGDFPRIPGFQLGRLYGLVAQCAVEGARMAAVNSGDAEILQGFQAGTQEKLTGDTIQLMTEIDDDD